MPDELRMNNAINWRENEYMLMQFHIMEIHISDNKSP